MITCEIKEGTRSCRKKAVCYCLAVNDLYLCRKHLAKRVRKADCRCCPETECAGRVEVERMRAARAARGKGLTLREVLERLPKMETGSPETFDLRYPITACGLSRLQNRSELQQEGWRYIIVVSPRNQRLRITKWSRPG